MFNEEKINLNMDELLNNDGKELLNTIENTKKHIKACINMDLFIETFKKYIDESEHFDFKSERSRKFINKEEPKFTLQCSLFENAKDLSDVELESLIDEITDKLSEEILFKVSGDINNYILDKSKYDEIFTELPREIKNICMSNIYSIRYEKTKNIIQIEYFV